MLDRHLHHLRSALTQQDTHDTKIETNLTESYSAAASTAPTVRSRPLARTGVTRMSMTPPVKPAVKASSSL